MQVGSWLAVMAPRGTPPDVVRKINADINRVLADPEVVAQLANFGFDGASQTPEQQSRLNQQLASAGAPPGFAHVGSTTSGRAFASASVRTRPQPGTCR